MKTKMVLQPNIKPTVSTSQKATIIFTTFGIFGVMLASFFIFNLTEIPKRKTNGPNLFINSSFEKWNNSIPIGWENKGAKVMRERKDVLDEKYVVAIYNEKDEPRGIIQTIQLNPLEIYNLCYSIKASNKSDEATGVEILYEGEDVKTTTDAASGLHYHEGGTKWRQYFGRVTGAKSVSLFFFAKKGTIAYVDAVAIGINITPTAIQEGETSSFSR